MIDLIDPFQPLSLKGNTKPRLVLNFMSWSNFVIPDAMLGVVEGEGLGAAVPLIIWHHGVL